MCKAGLHRYQTRYPEGFTVRIYLFFIYAAAVKEIIDDGAQDRRNILALTSQSPGPGAVRKSILMIRQVQGNRKERETIPKQS